MTQFNFHNREPLTPPQPVLSLTQKLINVYKLWHEFSPHFPKSSRHTLGFKVDFLFIETIESVIKALYFSGAEKLIYLTQASTKLDLLKFFLQIAWEIKSLDDKKYIRLSEKLDEIGKMLGGWIKAIK